jgi:hypothetical protein
MPLILGANSVSGYTVKNSLRFNSGSSDRLNRTESAGNRRTWTFSCWIKKTFNNPSPNYQALFTSSGTNYLSFSFIDTNALQFYNSSTVSQLITTQLFRDVSAWYNIVLAVDTTQATASNRVRIYVNGNEVTAFSTSTYPSQNTDLNINNSQTMYVGAFNTTQDFMNGYMSDVYMIDGQQLTPTSFGETDEDTGIWKPKAYTGTYGTNGFYLKFANSASLGTDSSGNGNNFTVNNLTSVDQSTDTPTNNFATGNPLDINTGVTNTFSEGNLKVYTTGITRSTIGVSSGKWYCEVKCVTTTAWNGITDVSKYINNEYTTNSVALYVAGATLYVGGVNQGSGGYGSAWSANDIMNLALDLDSGTKKLYFGKNGGWWNGSTYGASSPSTGVTLTNDITYVFSCGTGSGGDTNQWNFGSPMYSANSYTDSAGFGNFSYQVPSGFYSLCTRNLSTQG